MQYLWHTSEHLQTCDKSSSGKFEVQFVCQKTDLQFFFKVLCAHQYSTLNSLYRFCLTTGDRRIGAVRFRSVTSDGQWHICRKIQNFPFLVLRQSKRATSLVYIAHAAVLQDARGSHATLATTVLCTPAASRSAIFPFTHRDPSPRVHCKLRGPAGAQLFASLPVS